MKHYFIFFCVVISLNSCFDGQKKQDSTTQTPLSKDSLFLGFTLHMTKQDVHVHLNHLLSKGLIQQVDAIPNKEIQALIRKTNKIKETYCYEITKLYDCQCRNKEYIVFSPSAFGYNNKNELISAYYRIQHYRELIPSEIQMEDIMDSIAVSQGGPGLADKDHSAYTQFQRDTYSLFNQKYGGTIFNLDKGRWETNNLYIFIIPDKELQQIYVQYEDLEVWNERLEEDRQRTEKANAEEERIKDSIFHSKLKNL